MLRRITGNTLIRNALAMSWMQLATFLLPLLTLPYLARVLSDEQFGLVMFAQGFSILLGVLVEFGFGGSATRQASVNRDDPRSLAKLASSVLGAKLLLAMLTILACVLAYVMVTDLRHHPSFLVFAWIAAVAYGMNPGWYFMGIERAVVASIAQLSARVLSAALTFVLVQEANDGWLVMALYAAGAVWASGIISWMMYRQIPLRAPGLRASVDQVRSATTLFISSGALALYTSANVVILGLFVSPSTVAHYGAAERLLRATIQMMLIIGSVVAPRVAHLHSIGKGERARDLLRGSVLVTGGGGLLGGLVLAAIAPWLVGLVYGDDYDDSATVLRVLVLILPIFGVTTMLTGGWMIALHMDRAVLRVTLRAGIVNLVLGLTLTPLFGVIGLAAAVVIAEAVALGGCVYEIRRAEVTSGVVRLLRRPGAGRGQAVA